MDVREKHVIQKVSRKEKSICQNCIHHNLCIAENNQPCFECNRFIDANGVTVQEWVSAKDRLPEAGGYVVCIAKRNPFSRFIPMVARIEKNGWANPITEQYISEVTHWMPLPELPKGE